MQGRITDHASQEVWVVRVPVGKKDISLKVHKEMQESYREATGKKKTSTKAQNSNLYIVHLRDRLPPPVALSGWVVKTWMEIQRWNSKERNNHTIKNKCK